MREKCKMALAQIPRDILVISILVLASVASFYLGFLAGRDSGKGSHLQTLSASEASQFVDAVVASKSGTKYYRPNCSGAQRIADEKKVWFATQELARREGYEPAENCDGL